MDIISAIASINAIIIAILISSKKQKSISDYILIAWVINFAFHFAIPFCIEENILFHESLWGFFMGVFVVAHGPFIFVYTSSLINPDFKFNFKNFYHFGFIVIFILTFIPYLSLSPEERMEIVLQKENLSYYSLLPMLTLLFIKIYFLTRTIILLVRHQYTIKQAYSYEARINLAWIKLIVFGFLVLIVLSFIGYGLVSAQVISVFWMDYFMIMVNIVLFFFIAYWGYKQAAIRSPISTNAALSEKQKEAKPTPKLKATEKETTDTLDPVITELLKLMEKEKLYLEPELNIGNVASKLNLQSHQLSKLINTGLEKNFFEFVNEYRIKEFKKLVVNPKNKHISILGLAMDAGFNSKATFNRIFKNASGLTPSQFRESYKF